MVKNTSGGSWSTAVSSARFTINTDAPFAAATVSATPSVGLVPASYTIAATLNANGAIVVGDTVSITFPVGTTVASSISASSVAVGGVTCSVSPVVNPATRTVKVISPTPVSGSASLTVMITAGITNPTGGTPPTNYTLSDVRTNIQPVGSPSNTYAITAASQVSAANVTPSPSTVNTNAQYSFSFVIGGTADLRLRRWGCDLRHLPGRDNGTVVDFKVKHSRE